MVKEMNSILLLRFNKVLSVTMCVRINNNIVAPLKSQNVCTHYFSYSIYVQMANVLVAQGNAREVQGGGRQGVICFSGKDQSTGKINADFAHHVYMLFKPYV